MSVIDDLQGELDRMTAERDDAIAERDAARASRNTWLNIARRLAAIGLRTEPPSDPDEAAAILAEWGGDSLLPQSGMASDEPEPKP